MTLTLDAIRQTAGPILEGRPYFLNSSATSGNQTDLVDTLKLKSRARGDIYANGYLLRTAVTTSDRERQIETDDPDTGTVIVSPGWSSGVTTDSYEIWSTYAPTEVEEAINRALQRIGIPEEIDLVGVNAQRQYDLSAYTWIVSPQQIAGFLQRQGTVAGAYAWARIPDRRISMDESLLTLNLDGLTYSTSDTLRLVATRSAAGFGTLTLGADTIPLYDSPEARSWVAYEAIDELLRGGYARRLTDPRAQARAGLLQEVRAQILRYRNYFQVDHDGYSVWSRSSTRMGPSGRGI